MNNKIINFICAAAAIVIIAVTLNNGGRNMTQNLGYFNNDALTGAVARVDAAIANARAETDRLAAMPDKTYMNFVRPLMDNDQKVFDAFYPVSLLNNVNHSDESEKIMGEINQKLAEYASWAARHAGVYQGYIWIKAHEYDRLTPAQKMVVDDSIRAYELSGVNLPDDKKARLTAIEAELTKFGDEFENNLLRANAECKMTIADESVLGDMPAADINAARVDGGFEFSCLEPSYMAFMKYVTDRELRHKMFDLFTNRAGKNGDIVPRMLGLRQEQAAILGFASYADLALEARSAPNVDAVMKFLNTLADAVREPALAELSEIRARAAADGVQLSDWDMDFYLGKLRAEKFNLTDADVMPYLEAGHVTDESLKIIGEMFDIKFVRRDVPLWHADARYYDLTRDGAAVGGLYLDLGTRATKSQGAWEQEYKVRFVDAMGRVQTPQAVVVSNGQVGADGAPSLWTSYWANTLWHEMGHAMHSLMTRVDERDVSGTGTRLDVVEFPSQFLEQFVWSTEVLSRIGRHHKTGVEMPADLIEKIQADRNFGQALFIARQIDFTMFDMEIHRAHNLSMAGVMDIWGKTRARVGVYNYYGVNKTPRTFLHLFGHGYAAGYYSYLWAETFAADAYIAAANDPALARKFRDVILANGGARDMNELYREFMGRDPKPESLLLSYGIKD